MSLPYQIADTIEFFVLQGQGLDRPLPIADSTEPHENTLDIHLRADPGNGSDSADPSTWIFIGTSNRQEYPLRDNESVNLRVVRRNSIYFRAPTGYKLHMVCARINIT